jgi:hypothetical protein
VSNVYQQREKIKHQSAAGANSQVDQLRSALVAKRDSSVKAGHIEDIKVIDKALAQLDANSKNLSQTQSVAGSQAQSAQARQVINNVSAVISEKEALAIKSIRGVPSVALPVGKRFASMEGREPSNARYMRDNIKGLFQLVETKNA